jgi:hypothetical protein
MDYHEILELRVIFQKSAKRIEVSLKSDNSSFGGLVVSTPSFGREVKPSVPCRRFAACKRTL